jgi:hypothetical protein
MCEPVTLGLMATAATGGAAGAGALGALTFAQGATLALSAGSAVASTATAYQGARDQKAVANHNAQVAEQNAQDAIRQGDEEASKVRRQYAQVGGQQRAGFSAKGIDFEAGSAGDALDQTDFFSQIDQGVAKNNGQRAAWNARAQKKGFEMQASSIKPGMLAGATLLTSASSVADKWNSFKKPAKG